MTRSPTPSPGRKHPSRRRPSRGPRTRLRVFREIDRLPRAERQVPPALGDRRSSTRASSPSAPNKSDSAIRATGLPEPARACARRPHERRQSMNANAPRFNSDAIDHTIDRALSALRDAQPRSGLEGRILTSLEHRSATPQPTRFPISAQVALWAAASAAVLAVAWLIILHQHAVPAEFARAPQTHVPPIAAESAQLRVPQVSSSRPGFGSPRTSIEPMHRMAHRSAMPVPCAQSECPIHDGDAPGSPASSWVSSSGSHGVMNGASNVDAIRRPGFG